MSEASRSKVDTASCYFCARTESIEVHHIVPQRFNGSDKRENLVGVCERCHKKLEVLYDNRFYEAVGVTDETGERKSHYPCQWNCEKQAVAKVYSPSGGSDWLCKEHATQLLENKPNSAEVKQDLSGELEHENEIGE